MPNLDVLKEFILIENREFLFIVSHFILLCGEVLDRWEQYRIRIEFKIWLRLKHRTKIIITYMLS